MNFVTTHRHHTAFLANHLETLASLIVSQAETALKKADIPIRSRAVSALLLIAEREQTTIAEIAESLHQPHQLVTQRIEGLLKIGVIERHPDPSDGRRKLLRLTPHGRDVHQKLDDFLAQMTRVFNDLFKEIDCNLEKQIEAAKVRLAHDNLMERLD